MTGNGSRRHHRGGHSLSFFVAPNTVQSISGPAIATKEILAKLLAARKRRLIALCRSLRLRLIHLFEETVTPLARCVIKSASTTKVSVFINAIPNYPSQHYHKEIDLDMIHDIASQICGKMFIYGHLGNGTKM